MNNKKALFFSTALVCCLSVTSGQATDISTNTARLQAMDKITGHVTEIDVPVNSLATYGSFSVLVRKCVTKSPEETPENTAFVDVVDNYQTNKPVNIFKGWMFSSTPALNAVEHPIYDIWLLKCYNNRTIKATPLSEEQLALRDTIPMVREKSVATNQKITLAEDTGSEEISDDTELNKQENEPVAKPETIRLNVTSNSEKEPQNNDEEDEEFISEGEEDASDSPLSADENLIPDTSNEQPVNTEETSPSSEKDSLDTINIKNDNDTANSVNEPTTSLSDEASAAQTSDEANKTE